MARKYLLNEFVNIVSFVEQDVLSHLNELTQVEEFDKDTFLIAISENDFCKNIKKCHKNLLLITNNKDETDASYIKCQGSNYIEESLKIIDEFILLLNQKNPINLDVVDIVNELRKSEVTFIKETATSYEEVCRQLKKSLVKSNLSNVKTVFINIHGDDSLSLIDTNSILDSVREIITKDVNLVFSLVLDNNKSTSLIIV